ncbi:MAG: sensor histidine kinase [Oligoflexales bacterium]
MFKLFKKTFFLSNDKGAKSFLLDFIRWVFFWTPLLAVFFTIPYENFDHFKRAYGLCYSIAATIAALSMSGIEGLKQLESFIFRRSGQTEPVRGAIWHLTATWLTLVPSLFIGFDVGGRYAHAMGYNWTKPNIDEYKMAFAYGTMISLGFILYNSIKHYSGRQRRAEAKLARAEKAHLQTRLSALTAQMNPHLLFNSLNTIASTIQEHPDKAEEMTLRLSDLYRGILKTTKQPYHSLATELELCSAFLEIQKCRFGDRIDFEIILFPEVEAQDIQIPALLLQPLVENSIIHGLAPKREGGRVVINVERQNDSLILTITDNGLGNEAPPSKGSGTSVGNSKDRIEMEYGAEAAFHMDRTKNGTSVKITIPYWKRR